MTTRHQRQLVSYIAPAAPATRRPADGTQPFLRPEFGFTPAWYRQHLEVDFGRRWHTDPAYRRDSVLAMRDVLRRRFPEAPIGRLASGEGPPDLLTGTFGTCTVAALYGVPIRYAADGWPKSEPRYLSDDEASRLEPPSLDETAFFGQLMAQLEWIERECGRVVGFINWQGVLNNAHRLRGEALFMDMLTEPARASRLFECVRATMVEAARRVYRFQRRKGVEVRHFTVSNCLVNMIAPWSYRDLLLEHDRRIADEFERIGIHNCSWNVDPYLPHYAALPNVAYIDMGLSSNLAAAKAAFPDARRAVMYTPMELGRKSTDRIRSDLSRIARELGPSDVVFADVEAAAPDQRILDVIDCCRQISEEYESRREKGSDDEYGDSA